jgi:hypothetical protein
MTNPGGGATVATVQPVPELFTSSATALWATTYNVDLSLFNEFLLARLGDPPLNIAVLADYRRLAASLARIPAERVDTLAAVNQRWLLRGVRPGGQAFHPKTYLAVTASRATLLVGSGNLSAGGLDEGREVFTTFRSGTPVGDSAIAAWWVWMRRLVQLVDDTTLAERFRDLEGRIPPPPAVAPAVPSPLLHNLDTPIAVQLVAAVADRADRVDELWLTAPFYDSDAAAVGALLEMFTPARVLVFVTGSTSVNGDRLTERLTTSGAAATVAAYQPNRFVHAKLVGVIAGTRGWLLSGSANLSRAALTHTPATGGNVELAVLAPLGPDQVRAVFMPPSMTVDEQSLDSLVSLDFREEREPDQPSVRLVTASMVLDGRIQIVCDPPVADGWLLDDLSGGELLIDAGGGRAMTAGPLAGRLVQIVDDDGQVLSNRVVVDDPAGLAAALRARSAGPRVDRPPELVSGDLDTPLGQALIWVHRNLVMDVSERVTAAPTGGVGAGEADDQADDDLWDRLEREQLARDPRASAYGRIWRRNTLGGTEPIIELLEALRYRLPAESATGGSSLLGKLLTRTPEDEPSGGDGKPVRRWKASTRIRVRARNLLRRWAAAQTDPRLVWVDPLALAGNFAMIAAMLAHLRLDRTRDPDRVELTNDDLDDLWRRWLRPFVGTGEGDGWFELLDDAARILARDRLPEWLPEAVAALCWLAVQPGSGRRERVVTFQSVLTAAFSHDLIEPTNTTAQYLSAVTGRVVTPAEVDTQLLNAVDYIDDALWCSRTAEELAFEGLNLQTYPGATRLRLDVRGITNPLLDPRVPRLVVLVRRYRRCDRVALFAADASWRLSFATDETIAYRPDRNLSMIESTSPLAAGVLESLAGSAGVLADLLPNAEQVA